MQAPNNTQSLNRYVYVFNNPLSNTDPSGYVSFGPDGLTGNPWVDLFIAVAKYAYDKYQDKLRNTIPSIPAGRVLGGFGSSGGTPTSGGFGNTTRQGWDPRVSCPSFAMCHNGGGPLAPVIGKTVGQTASEGTGWKFANGGITFSFGISLDPNEEDVQEPLRVPVHQGSGDLPSLDPCYVCQAYSERYESGVRWGAIAEEHWRLSEGSPAGAARRTAVFVGGIGLTHGKKALGELRDALDVFRRAKPVNLPSWKKIDIDIKHIIDRHTVGGIRTSARADKFPENMTTQQIERAVRQAYRYGKKVETQGERVRVRGDGIEMWVNTKTKTIETAYPL